MKQHHGLERVASIFIRPSSCQVPCKVNVQLKKRRYLVKRSSWCRFPFFQKVSNHIGLQYVSKTSASYFNWKRQQPIPQDAMNMMNSLTFGLEMPKLSSKWLCWGNNGENNSSCDQRDDASNYKHDISRRNNGDHVLQWAAGMFFVNWMIRNSIGSVTKKVQDDYSVDQTKQGCHSFMRRKISLEFLRKSVSTF